MIRHTLMGAGKAERLAARVLYVPKDAEPIHTSPEATIYRYPMTRGGYAVVVFWGSAGKPTAHYSYRSLEQANRYVESWIDRVSLHRVEQLRKKQTAKAWENPLTVGTILYTSWGYDQTNVEFYAVTRVSGRRVWVREIASDAESIGYMQSRCWPAVPIRFAGPETMHTAQPSGEKGAYIKISESQTAWVEDGRTHYSSSYA